MTNLFVTNVNPAEAPKDLDDNRLITACLESSQILGTALYRRGLWNVHMYRPLWNHNHVVAVWAAASKNNFRWMYHYAEACCDEYKYRFNRLEENSNRIQISLCWDAFRLREVFSDTALTEFPNTTPYKTLYITDAYRRYMNEEKWSHSTPVWTKRGPPVWYKTKELRVTA